MTDAKDIEEGEGFKFFIPRFLFYSKQGTITLRFLIFFNMGNMGVTD